MSIVLVSVLALSAVWSTGQLIDDLIHGGKETNSASALLKAGGSVWASAVLAFSLLYFELDSGSAAARAHRMPATPELAFPNSSILRSWPCTGALGTSTTCPSA